MDSESMVAEPAADVQIVDALASALIEGALPGEIEGFTDAARLEAARFLAAAARRQGIGDGIDQEGHIVVDDRDSHVTLAERSAERLKLDQRLAALATARGGGEESRGLETRGIRKAFDLAGEGAFDQG